VPARRSRTQQWRRCLEEILERRGTLEIAVTRAHFDGSKTDAAGYHDQSPTHLLWRVRLLSVDDEHILVEQPVALGKTVELNPDVELAAIIAIGQNRWMFRTRTLAAMRVPGRDGRTTSVLRLSVPDQIERCQRRHHYRVHTASLNLPDVELWPLLDPKSVLLAERLNEMQYRHQQEPHSEALMRDAESVNGEASLPEVGPRLTASLMNLGGGGVGLQVNAADAAALGRHKLYWMRFLLQPELATPICATGKLVHTHIESSQDVYAGMAFDFSFNPGHQQFVLDQICRYIALQQRAQMQEALAASNVRRQSA